MPLPEAKIEVIGLPVSNFVRAVRMVCEEKGLDYDVTPVPPHSPEAREAHPLGRIPALRHGDVTIAESGAITRYLDSVFPERPMMPSAPAALAAEVNQWVSVVMTGVDQIMVRQYAFAYLFPGTTDGSPDHEAVAASRPKLEAIVAMLDRALEGREFLAGDEFSFADILLMVTATVPPAFPEGAQALDAAPNLKRYIELHSQRPSFVATQVAT
jgi:glutathione S-transferase